MEDNHTGAEEFIFALEKYLIVRKFIKDSLTKEFYISNPDDFSQMSALMDERDGKIVDWLEDSNGGIEHS